MQKVKNDDTTENNDENDDSEKEEYFKPEKINEYLNPKKKPHTNYFDLSNIEMEELTPHIEKKQIFTKLNDDSPEVNLYAEKRAKLFKE